MHECQASQKNVFRCYFHSISLVSHFYLQASVLPCEGRYRAWHHRTSSGHQSYWVCIAPSWRTSPWIRQSGMDIIRYRAWAGHIAILHLPPPLSFCLSISLPRRDPSNRWLLTWLYWSIALSCLCKDKKRAMATPWLSELSTQLTWLTPFELINASRHWSLPWQLVYFRYFAKVRAIHTAIAPNKP